MNPIGRQRRKSAWTKSRWEIALLLLIALACNRTSQRADGEVALAGGGEELVEAVARDTTLTAAERALDEGHAWRATRLLVPVLQDPARRTPAAVLLAARAAA